MADPYFALPGTNWSSLKIIATSPKAYRHALTHPRGDSPTFQLGRMVHRLVLEPDTFADEFITYDGVRNKRHKAYQTFLDAHLGKVPVKPGEVAHAIDMATAVAAHPAAAVILSSGSPELVMQWVEGGRKCKAKSDWLIESATEEQAALLEVEPGACVVVELKMTNNLAGFGREAAKYGYHGQLAHYAKGAEYRLGRPVDAVAIIAVHNVAPYDAGVFRLDAEARRAGAVYRQGLLSLLDECEASDEWPGMWPGVHDLDLPAWADGVEEELNFEVTDGE